jgi:predicted membrane metal-binding protein
MSNYRLRSFAFAGIGLLIVTAITLFAVAPSWSQVALTALGFLLTAALIFIASAFGERAVSHPLKRMVLLKWFNKPIRLEHTSRFIQICFFAIVIFPSTQVEVFHEIIEAQGKSNTIHKIVDLLHYPATALAVIGIYAEMVSWHPMWSKKWWYNFISINLSVGYFLLELIYYKFFNTSIVSIAAGELAIAYAAFGHIISTNFKHRK